MIIAHLKMKTSLVLSLALAIASATALIKRDTTGPTIESYTYSGSGCPDGTTTWEVGQDQQRDATVSFIAFQLGYDPTSRTGDTNLNCTVDFNVSFPAGTQSPPVLLDLKGWSQIENSSTASVIMTETFYGQSPMIDQQVFDVTLDHVYPGQEWTQDAQIDYTSGNFAKYTSLTISVAIDVDLEGHSGTDGDDTVAIDFVTLRFGETQ
jgi:hypothetical protein